METWCILCNTDTNNSRYCNNEPCKTWGQIIKHRNKNGYGLTGVIPKDNPLVGNLEEFHQGKKKLNQKHIIRHIQQGYKEGYPLCCITFFSDGLYYSKGINQANWDQPNHLGYVQCLTCQEQSEQHETK